MSKQVKFRRGTNSAHTSYIGGQGEITVDTDKNTCVVHDGSQAGGYPLAKEDLSNVSANTIANKGIAKSDLSNVSQYASETEAGIVELATSSETITGVDTLKATTPAGVKAVIDSLPISVTEYTDLTDTPSAYLTPNALFTTNNSADGIIELETTLSEPNANEFTISKGSASVNAKADLTIEAQSAINQDITTDANVIFNSVDAGGYQLNGVDINTGGTLTNVFYKDTDDLDTISDGATFVKSENNLTDILKLNYDSAFSHSQVTSGNPHQIASSDLADGTNIALKDTDNNFTSSQTIGGSIVSGQTDSSATSITNLDVSGVNSLVLTASSDIDLYGFSGGTSGQILHLVIINDVIAKFHHNDPLGDQPIFTETAGDMTNLSARGVTTFVNVEGNWWVNP